MFLHCILDKITLKLFYFSIFRTQIRRLYLIWSSASEKLWMQRKATFYIGTVLYRRRSNFIRVPFFFSLIRSEDSFTQVNSIWSFKQNFAYQIEDSENPSLSWFYSSNSYKEINITNVLELVVICNVKTEHFRITKIVLFICYCARINPLYLQLYLYLLK